MLLEFSIIGFSPASWDLIISSWNLSMLPYWRGSNLLRNMGRGRLPSRTGSSHQDHPSHWTLCQFCDEIKGYEFEEHLKRVCVLWFLKPRIKLP